MNGINYWNLIKKKKNVDKIRPLGNRKNNYKSQEFFAAASQTENRTQREDTQAAEIPNRSPTSLTPDLLSQRSENHELVTEDCRERIRAVLWTAKQLSSGKSCADCYIDKRSQISESHYFTQLICSDLLIFKRWLNFFLRNWLLFFVNLTFINYWKPSVCFVSGPSTSIYFSLID